ncbi:Reticulocyte binding protein 2 b like [Heracleum sosnowskyi]|uniref:Reticulocyte binding protein 2 b like n=1 Tax=Heracleum sosnowskyi TaxID=360622 RepID=A0AAD8IW14_9APIA|nr:Reticulocyte binding protein 2 b like [Heracleum sosnowskyi]
MALFDNWSSDLTDPCQPFSLLSICHRTYKDIPASNDSDNLDSVHNFRRSTVLNNSDKLFDEAKEVINSVVSGSELAPNGASENNNEAVTKLKRNLEERRPGLGLKRARPSFCLKPDKGPPSVSLETTLDIDKMQDPEELFSAFYKNEFAREEIERQTGGSMTGKMGNNPPANQRRRRPSLSGFREKASYKHKYSSAIPESDETTIASQETSEQEKLSLSNFVSQKHSVELQEGQSGSVSNSENAVGGMLDELLSRDIEDLDPDGALSLLQEQLQIKPLDLDKYLHDFSDAGNIDIMDLEEEMPVRRKALSDIQNVVNGSIDENPVSRKQVTRNKSHSLMSSTPPKRLSAASSSFGERKSLSKSFHFPFSAADLDLSPAKIPTHECFNGQLDELGTMNEPSIHGVINFQVENEVESPACAASGSKQVIPGDICLGKSSSLDTRSTDIDTRTKHSHDGLVNANECNHVGEILHEIVSSVQPDIGNDDLARGSPDTAGQAHASTESEKDIENIHQEASSTQQDVDIVNSATENSKISQSELGNKEPIAAEDQSMDGRAANAESGLEQQNEEHPEVSLKDRRKADRPLGSKKKKAPTRRQSLAAAGTSWDGGVRRSNRIKIRPLEYWKGERFIRGRVHESLDTVIGIKCISTPSPGRKVCRFKVTAYVSEQKELVEKIALH